MLERWKTDKVTAHEALNRFAETKESLRNMNKALSDRARKLQSSLSGGSNNSNAEEKNESQKGVSRNSSSSLSSSTSSIPSPHLSSKGNNHIYI
uniref:Uncharacterized protein n=1 Tax=Panagrolaimus sp. PS1159 TaxID=55785 RepID=A0AC35G5E3_9BILA